MPASIILECPHCGAEKMGFTLAAEAESRLGSRRGLRRFRVLLICSKCEEGVVATFDAGVMQSSPCNSGVDPTELGWVLTDSYPKPQPSTCPSHTPDNLKRIFLQAANALKRGDPDASGAMSRKVVDVSTQQLLGEKSKQHGNIQGRIDALAAEGKLTPDLKDWAHQVRIGGNEAAHDADLFTQDEADELLVFVELYLTYVYSLPGRLKDCRERAKKEKAAAGKAN